MSSPGPVTLPDANRERNAAMLQMLRDARAMAYRDAESFDQAAAVLEHVGQLIAGEIRNGLGNYESEILGLAGQAPCTNARHLRQLFHTVRRARNDSVHSGDFIRHHVLRLVELLLYLEEALSMHGQLACDVMVRGPITAELWHTVAMARRTMLTNSFSYLPICLTSGEWGFVSDDALVRYLGGFQTPGRNERLSADLGTLIQSGQFTPLAAKCFDQNVPVNTIRDAMQHAPVLITAQSRLVGIVTAFDLL